MAVLWRRLLVLLIGGVIAVPYVAVVIWMVTAWNRLADRPSAWGVVAVGIIVFCLLCIPGFLPVIRALERTLAEQLLELVIPTPLRRPRAADRIRGALFYFGHAFAGALLLFTVIVMFPSAIVLAVDPEQMPEFSFGLPVALVQILAPAILLLLAAIIIAEGYFLPHYAQILLGPSATDRAELAGAERVSRFRRTMLAREVHDSIGHALTVTTMQSAVARRALQTDPVLAEAALDEIARTGREAVAELDHVLSLLRSEADGTSAPAVSSAAADPDPEADDHGWDGPPRRTLRDIERLVVEARSVGHPTELEVDGDVGALPPAVAHELHRIVREALTNSLRHASAPGMTITIRVDAARVRVVTGNAGPRSRTGAGGSGRRSGRGLEGIRERVELHGGTVDWGAHDGYWTLEAVLPLNGKALA